MQRLSLETPKRMKDRLTKEAKALGLPLNEYIRRIIDRYWDMEWIVKDIYIMSQTAAKLRAEAKQEGVPVPELLQRIIDRYFEKE